MPENDGIIANFISGKKVLPFLFWNYGAPFLFSGKQKTAKRQNCCNICATFGI